MPFFKLGDTISGQEAKAVITLYNADGSTTVEDLFIAKSLEATATLQKTAGRTLGKRGDQHKITGWSGEGTMTLYYASSIFRRIAIEYITSGTPLTFDLYVENDDPGSTIGSQSTILRNCLIDSVVVAKFDVDADFLDEDVSFTFDDVSMPDEFQAPNILGV